LTAGSQPADILGERKRYYFREVGKMIVTFCCT